jgi:xanthine dehydrogenase molybdopterin-binding subunit B
VENHRYTAEGRLESVGAGRYLVPTVSSIPQQMNVTLLKDAANPHAVYSSKVRAVCALY